MARRRGKFRRWWRSAGMMDRILVCLAVFLLAFTVAMIAIHIRCGTTPDTLIVSVFSVCGGECGVMGWIKSAKERNQERKWRDQENNQK